MKNPFTLTFGKEPISIVERGRQTLEIIEAFTDDNPAYQVCMITGVRGSGKTVMLTDISKYFRNLKDWIVVDLSPERDLLQALTANLSNHAELMELFRDAKINLSFLGLGLELDGVPPVTDITVALTRMLERVDKCGKKVLVTIDEAVCNQPMREFTSMFQIFMRQDLPVFLLMTGLYENIYELQNEKTLTFLYRAPKVELCPLNREMVAIKYMETLKISREEADQMAQVIMGYPFAFQTLGYLCFKENAVWSSVMPQFRQYLAEFVYEKLWSEMSGKDRKVLRAMAEIQERKVENIRQKAGMSSGEFAVYRDRLLKKGVVFSPEYGFLDFTLPQFAEFCSRQ